jgi:hypothetical protein
MAVFLWPPQIPLFSLSAPAVYRFSGKGIRFTGIFAVRYMVGNYKGKKEKMILDFGPTDFVLNFKCRNVGGIGMDGGMFYWEQFY